MIGWRAGGGRKLLEYDSRIVCAMCFIINAGKAACDLKIGFS